MKFASAISEHPEPTVATGEAVGQLMEQLGEGADLVTLFVTSPFAGALEDIAAAVNTLLDPQVLIGCASSGVIGSGREVQNAPGIALWGGHIGPVVPVRLEVIDLPTGGQALGGWPIDVGWVPAASVLFGDPFTFPVQTLFDTLNGPGGGFPRVTGGMVSGGYGPGASRLVLGETVYSDGAVGVLLQASTDVVLQTVVAPGCRPIGRPYVVTRVEDNVIYELGGETVFRRLSDMANHELSPEELAMANSGLLVGKVIDEHKAEFGPGDFLLRTIIDADPVAGSLTIGEKVEIGTTVQFHLRDAGVADQQLQHLLAAGNAQGVLMFSCHERGTSLFDMENHDAAAVAELLKNPSTAGFFASAEFGPVAGHNFVHGFSSSMALFSAQTPSPQGLQGL